MAGFDVFLKKSANKELEILEGKIRLRVDGCLQYLKEKPLPFREYDLAKLKGFEDTYRIRIGNVRIVYEVLADIRTILVLKVRKRERII